MLLSSNMELKIHDLMPFWNVLYILTLSCFDSSRYIEFKIVT